MTLREAERRHKQRQQSNPIHDREIELARPLPCELGPSKPERGRETELSRALDDQRVMTFPQWCEVNGFSIWTGKRLVAAGKGPKITQISDRRIGITVGNNRRWQKSRERA